MQSFLSQYSFRLVLVLAALLASLTSLSIGLHQSIWFDEAYSILVAEHSWAEIVHLTSQDVHPPVYYWLLKAWMMLFGSSELSLRGMSALFLGLSVVATGLLLRKFFGAKAALQALPFLVFAPYLLRYGFEIRMYALCSLIGVVATYILVIARDEEQIKKRRLLYLIYALLVALGIYTLYFMALLWIAHLVWLISMAFIDYRRDKIIYPVIAYSLAFLMFLPWLPVFLSKTNGGTLSPVTSHLDLENLYGLMTFIFLSRPPWDAMGVSMVIVASIVLAILYLSRQGWRKASEKERQYVVLLAMHFLIPVLILVVVTHYRAFYIERYTAHVVIGLYACVGSLAALAGREKPQRSQLAASGIILVLLMGCVSLVQFGNYNFQRLHKPSVKNIAILLNNCKDGAVIFADGPQVAVELGYYTPDCPVYFFNKTLKMGGGFAMLSDSPLRVADADELPKSKEVLHVYYDIPKQSMPEGFDKYSTVTIETLSVTSYRIATD